MKGIKAIWSWIIPALLVLTPLGGEQTRSSQAAQEALVLADWIVSDVQVVENQSISLEGNLVIKEGGSLTLRFVTLTLTGQFPGQYRIEVEPGVGFRQFKHLTWSQLQVINCYLEVQR